LKNNLTDDPFRGPPPKGEMFGKGAFRRIIRARATEPPKEIIVAILNAIEDFRSTREQEDDVALVVINVEG
jgi:serine phosphatase RsbU (regulator of sigma subunit)